MPAKPATKKKEAYHHSGCLPFNVCLPPLLTGSKKSANKEKCGAKSVGGWKDCSCVESMGRSGGEVRRMQIGQKVVQDKGPKVVTLKEIQDDICKAFDCKGKDSVVNADDVCADNVKNVKVKPTQGPLQCSKDKCNVKPTKLKIKDTADNTEYICKDHAKDIKCDIKPVQANIKDNACSAENVSKDKTKPVQGNTKQNICKDNAKDIKCNTKPVQGNLKENNSKDNAKDICKDKVKDIKFNTKPVEVNTKDNPCDAICSDNAKPVQSNRKEIGDNVKCQPIQGDTKNLNVARNRKEIKKDCECEKFLKALEKEIKKKEKAERKEREKRRAMAERAQKEREKEREKEWLRAEREQRERDKERERREKELSKITNSKIKCNSKKNPTLLDIRKSAETNCGKCCQLLELYLKETCKFYSCLYFGKEAEPSHFEETFCQLMRSLACMCKDCYQFLRYFYHLLFV